MTVLESNTQGKITSYLKKLGHPYIKTTGAGSRGWPDITAVINSRMVCLEVKKEGKVPTVKQQTVGDAIRKAGGIWVSYDNAEDAYEIIDHVESMDKINDIDYSKVPKSLKCKKEIVHV